MFVIVAASRAGKKSQFLPKVKSDHAFLPVRTFRLKTYNPGLHAMPSESAHSMAELEECLAMKQRAEHAIAKSQFLLKSQRSKSCHAFLLEGIQIEDLTQASCHA